MPGEQAWTAAPTVELDKENAGTPSKQGARGEGPIKSPASVCVCACREGAAMSATLAVQLSCLAPLSGSVANPVLKRLHADVCNQSAGLLSFTLQTTRRRPLSSLGGSATKQKPAKRARKSMGRRVSFAPDQRLEQTHFYERVRLAIRWCLHIVEAAQWHQISTCCQTWTTGTQWLVPALLNRLALQS